MGDFRSGGAHTYILMPFKELAESTDGSIPFDFTADHAFSSVVTDSRNAVSGSLFVPLRGENRDGH